MLKIDLKFFLKKYHILILFILALIFRMVVLLSVSGNLLHLSPDSTGYHNLAVEIARGNGYTCFFREPAYPAFLATGYKIWQFFGGDLYNVNFVNDWNPETGLVSDYHKEIIFIKFYQAFFDSLSVIILFFILSFIIPKKKAFLISLLYGLFWPVALVCNNMLRESFQTLILLLMNYFFVKALFTKKKYNFILFSLFWAISNITLQITSALVPFVFIFTWIFYRKFKKAFIVTVSTSLITGIFLMPWLFYVYSYYPDLRIIKTNGCALTFERRKLGKAVGKAYKLKIISENEYHEFKSKEFVDTFNECFSKSFNGHYLKKADLLNTAIRNVESDMTLSEIYMPKVRELFKYSGLHFWVIKSWGLHKSIKQNIKEKNALPILLYGFAVCFGLLCFFGFLIYYKEFFPILLVFAFIWSLSYFIGNEYRRLLPAYPYVFSFGVMGGSYLYNRIRW